MSRYSRRRKYCRFTAEGITEIDYKDLGLLKAYVTETGKIVPSRITGTKSHYQRQLSTAVKRARSCPKRPPLLRLKRQLLAKPKRYPLLKPKTNRPLMRTPLPKRPAKPMPGMQRQKPATKNLKQRQPRNRQPTQKAPDGESNHESIFTQT